MTQILAAIGLAISLLSFATGAYTTHWYYRVSQLQADNRLLRLNGQRFKSQLGLSQSIDARSREREITDNEILQAILAKAPPAEVPSCPNVPAPVCVDADSMRNIGRIGAQPRNKR